MEYLKISKLAKECEDKRLQIIEYYSILGGNKLSEDANKVINDRIDIIKIELQQLEARLRKLVK